MPFATLSAQQLAPFKGDRRTHIFNIDTNPFGNMFSADGNFVKLDANGQAAVTLDFACQRCHGGHSLNVLSVFAKGFHDRQPDQQQKAGPGKGFNVPRKN